MGNHVYTGILVPHYLIESKFISILQDHNYFFRSAFVYILYLIFIFDSEQAFYLNVDQGSHKKLNCYTSSLSFFLISFCSSLKKKNNSLQVYTG
jgi:hypothetical protein